MTPLTLPFGLMPGWFHCRTLAGSPVAEAANMTYHGETFNPGGGRGVVCGTTRLSQSRSRTAERSGSPAA